MKNVLLLGDSIRMNYQDSVKELLGEEFAVFAPAENCRFSAFTLNTLHAWLPLCPNPEVIHWNNGIWDVVSRYAEDGSFTPIEEYLRNMGRICRELKKTGAKVIFATTTPLLRSAAENDNIVEYNRRVVAALEGRVDAVNDLYGLVYPNRDAYICEDKVHLSEAGKRACGEAVAAAIRAMA